MELFYSSDISADTVRLDREESGHCVKVLRHRAGDAVSVIDGLGALLHCTLLDADPREAVLRIDSREEGWGALPYRLTLGVCPTKNTDRFEWAVEKATEFGVDCIAPLIGERSERRVFKPERARRIALSAAKQSLKARIPAIPDALPVREFLAGAGRPPMETRGLLQGASHLAPSPTRGDGQLAGGDGQLSGGDGPREIHLPQQCAHDGLLSGGDGQLSGGDGPREIHLPQQCATGGPERAMGVEGEPILPHHPQQYAPECSEMPVGVAGEFHGGQLRLIACCFDGPDWQRVSMREALEAAFTPKATETRTNPSDNVPGTALEVVPDGVPGTGPDGVPGTRLDGVPGTGLETGLETGPETGPEIIVLVGPEGDFSPEEVEAARAAGFVPVHLGTSRLRTETAAVAAAAFVYNHFI